MSQKQNRARTPYPQYNNYGNYKQPANKPEKQPHSHKWIVWIVVLVGLFLVGHTVWAKEVAAHEKQVIANAQAAAAAKALRVSQFSSATQNIINNNSAITFEVSAIDLSNNKETDFGGTSPMLAASDGKLLTAAYFMHEVEAGDESLTENIGGSSAQTDLQQMLVVSDDPSWEALNNDLGYPQLQSYANSIGITDYNSVANTLSASDIANLLAKLYEGKLLNKENTNLILGYLKQANYRTFIVPAVPADDTVYHKIGELNDNVNDAAIITNNNGQAFVIVIFTNGNGTYNWTQRAVLFQQIATSAINAYLGN